MNTDLPGKRIREFRNKAGRSWRDLAKLCDPPMDYTSIGRIERGYGYTGDSLERFAKVLNCEVYDFFLPDELLKFSELPPDYRTDVSKLIDQLALAAKARTAS